MVIETMQDAERLVAEVKSLFGRPALFNTEDEAAYDKLMAALALTVRPKNVLDLMQLNDMTYSEWRKNWLRHQQSLTIERGVHDYRAAQARRFRVETDSTQGKAEDAADLAQLKNRPAAEQREFQLENRIEESVENLQGILHNDRDEVDYQRSLKANINFYGVIDEFIQTEIDRRDQSAQWMLWYRDLALQPDVSSAKQIDGEVIAEQKDVLPQEVPLAPADKEPG